MNNKSFSQKLVISAAEGIKGGLALLAIAIMCILILKYPGQMLDIITVAGCTGILLLIISFWIAHGLHRPRVNGHSSPNNSVHYGDQ